MKPIIYTVLLTSLITTQSIQATGNASEFSQQAWDEKVEAYTKMEGRTFTYTVSGYVIKLHFDGEQTISWERLEAPDDTAGLKGTQNVDRQNIHPGIFVMAWTEDDGSQVIDVVDTQRMQLFANFVMPDGQRLQTQAQLEEIN